MYFITSVSEDDTRCVGYVSTLKEARSIVENNVCDLHEAGCYPWCVIEHVKEGLYQYDTQPIWFEYDRDVGGYVKIDHKPYFIGNSIGFAIG